MARAELAGTLAALVLLALTEGLGDAQAEAAGPFSEPVVVVRRELEAWGARDLMDVLRRVPGFDFGVDVQGVVGASYRGVWGHEGRILVFIDGQLQNELLFGTAQFGNHYSLEGVERVEITRGGEPFGVDGNPELARVNLVTRSAAELHGVAASVLDGERANGNGERKLSVAAGTDLHALLGGSAGIALGEGNRSGEVYRDIFGSRTPLTPPHQELNPLRVQAEAHVGELQARFFLDRLSSTESDGTVAIHRPYAMSFSNLAAQVGFLHQASEQLALSAQVDYLRQSPWNVPHSTAAEHLDKKDQRLQASGLARWTPVTALSGELGFIGALDRVWLNSGELQGAQTLERGKAAADYEDFAAFAQTELVTQLGSLQAGVRVELQSEISAAPSARLGYSRRWSQVRLELSGSTVARIPALENFNASPVRLRPERATSVQALVGATPWVGIDTTFAIFDTRITQPVFYVTDLSNGVAGYRNTAPTGTRGLEVTGRAALTANLGLRGFYVFSTPAGQNRVALLAVPGRADLLLAFPAHTLSLGADASAGAHWRFNLNLRLTSERAGFSSLDRAGVPKAATFQPLALVDAAVSYQNLITRGLDASVALMNSLNQSDLFIQPYDGGHAPLPGAGREIVLRLTYLFSLARDPVRLGGKP